MKNINKKKSVTKKTTAVKKLNINIYKQDLKNDLRAFSGAYRDLVSMGKAYQENNYTKALTLINWLEYKDSTPKNFQPLINAIKGAIIRKTMLKVNAKLNRSFA